MKKIACLVSIIMFIWVGNIWAEDAKTVETRLLAKSSVSWDGQRLPEYPPGIPEISIVKVKIPPGSKLQFHKHPVINAGCYCRVNLP